MNDVLRNIALSALAAALFGGSPAAWAQDAEAERRPDTIAPPDDIEQMPLEEVFPDGLPEDGEPLQLRPPGEIPDIDIPAPDVDEGIGDLVDATIDVPEQSPDYSRLPESAERKVRLDKLFARLQAETNAENANLIAEEIWAIWLDSGSASVNMVLRRGTAAQKRGNSRLARRMYNHVTELAPNYAEGWSRSARLALEEDDLSRALSEATQALILEPRQFYAHWTLGNIFEKIGRNEAALEAYKEANRLYPELKAVKDRLEMIQGSVEGDVL